jgi:hypothetical protein
MGSPTLSNDLKGSRWKIKLYERFFVTYTENAPLIPSDGLIVPER